MINWICTKSKLIRQYKSNKNHDKTKQTPHEDDNKHKNNDFHTYIYTYIKIIYLNKMEEKNN